MIAPDSQSPVPARSRVPKPLAQIHSAFRLIAQHVARGIGSPWAFMTAVAIVIVWALVAPICHFSDTWQLVINTTSSIVTFLMVFLIQNTQNRDAKAIHLKLDELIRAMEGARNRLVNLEDLTDDELDRLEDEFRRIRESDTNKSARRGTECARLSITKQN